MCKALEEVEGNYIWNTSSSLRISLFLLYAVLTFSSPKGKMSALEI